MTFEEQELLILVKSNLLIFLNLWFMFFGVLHKKIFAKFKDTSTFFHKFYNFSVYILWPILIFIYGVREEPNFLFCFVFAYGC